MSGTSLGYGYDQADRLTSYSSGGVSQATYAYDGDGLRQSKTVTGITTAFTWDQSAGLPLLLQAGTTSYILHGVRQGRHLRPLLLVGRGHHHGQQVAQRVHRQVRLRPPLALMPIVAGTSATAVGWASRPRATRSRLRRSCTMASKAPAARQRCVCWYTAAQGGRSCGSSRQCTPVFTT